MLYFLRNLMVKFNECKVASDFIRAASQSEAFSVIKSALATKRATLKSGKIDENLHTEALKKIDAKCEILLNLAAKYGGIYEFYNFLTLGARELSEGDGVNLMSVHSSKGLEFSHLFVIGLEEGFRHRFSAKSLSKFQADELRRRRRRGAQIILRSRNTRKR